MTSFSIYLHSLTCCVHFSEEGRRRRLRRRLRILELKILSFRLPEQQPSTREIHVGEERHSSSLVSCLRIQHVIIWQGSLEGNPSVLIGSFLVGTRHMDRFHGNGHKLRIFCFRKPENSKQAWPKCHIINYFLT